MKHYAEAQGFTLIFAHLAAVVMDQFKRRGFDMKEDGHFRTFADLDRGVEWCENRILMDEHVFLDGQRPGLEDQLRDFLPPGTEVESIMKYLERREVPEGYVLIRHGDPPHSLYFLESGQVTAQLDGKGETVRLRTMGPGTVVGELGLYLKLPSTATVVTDRPSLFYRLTAESLEKLEKNEPEIASAFHKYIIHCLGERLMHTNQSLRALMD
jgi:sulfate permease, SulP family